MKKTLLSALMVLWSGSALAADYSWEVTNSWSPALEDKFSEFVSILGTAKVNGRRACRSLDECLKNPASNPLYHARTPKDKFLPADCADYPYALRMYFAWMEGLPFDYVSSPQLVESDDPRGDLRYSKYGNRPSSIKSFTDEKTHDFYKSLIKMRGKVYTATYRMHYQYQSDFYPTELSGDFVRPGTVAYDPAGHAAIVYKVEKDGRIRMMDAHPDNSVTRITYDKKFVRSRPAHGAGLRNWRPELNDEPTENLNGFSKVQFKKNSEFKAEGFSDYYDYVRTTLAGGTLKYNPIVETKNMVLELCSNLQDRVASVDAAIRKKISHKRQPKKLPENIYGTHGEWENYSTPSRDARLKVAFVEMRNDVEKFFKMLESGDEKLDYQGETSRDNSSCDSQDCRMAADILASINSAADQNICQISYSNSDGRSVEMSFEQMLNRLFKMSFDPYHCIEKRWGAQSEDELASCRDGEVKSLWYDREQPLRNQIERTYDARMDYGIDQIHTELGVKEAPDVDVLGYLKGKIK